MAREAACDALAVSRETGDRLQTFLDLLAVWQARINLVGPGTLRDPWRRHILDCGQLWRHWPAGAKILVDLGSGAGLPGLILAILGAPETHLIESDRRKAAFLREAARVCGVGVAVHARRSDQVPALAADVLAARAVAPLPDLLALAARHVHGGTTCLLLKGRTAPSELTRAREAWTMTVRVAPSASDPEGQVLIITEIRRAVRRSA